MAGVPLLLLPREERRFRTTAVSDRLLVPGAQGSALAPRFFGNAGWKLGSGGPPARLWWRRSRGTGPGDPVRILIVEDGTQRGALAAVRSLGVSGYEVAVASPERGHAARSRWSARWHQIPAPAGDTTAFADAIQELVERHGYDIAFGVGDAEAVALSRHREQIGCALGYPPHDIVETAFDKILMTELARSVGLRVPQRLDPLDPKLTFPVVVKERSHGPDTAEATSMRVFAAIADDRDELVRAVASIEKRGGEVIVEEFVDGLLEAVFLYAYQGHVWACGRSIADRVFPRGVGASTRSVTVPLDPALMAQIEDLIAKLEWTGVAQLQFLRPLGGDPTFIDFNGRFYGSLSLSVAAGVNLPLIWVNAIEGELPSEWMVAPPGIRYHWLEGDLRSAWSEPPDRRWREMAVSLAWSVRRTHSIWRIDDPRPALSHSSVLGLRAVAKVLRWNSRRS